MLPLSDLRFNRCRVVPSRVDSRPTKRRSLIRSGTAKHTRCSSRFSNPCQKASAGTRLPKFQRDYSKSMVCTVIHVAVEAIWSVVPRTTMVAGTVVGKIFLMLNSERMPVTAA